jgi:hypothetical protein
MVARRPTAAADQERLEIRPLIVRHQSANHCRSPQRAALNQFAILASIDLSTRPSRERNSIPPQARCALSRTSRRHWVRQVARPCRSEMQIGLGRRSYLQRGDSGPPLSLGPCRACSKRSKSLGLQWPSANSHRMEFRQLQFEFSDRTGLNQLMPSVIFDMEIPRRFYLGASVYRTPKHRNCMFHFSSRSIVLRLAHCQVTAIGVSADV